MESHSIIPATDWLSYTANLGTYIFLIGALMQYAVIRLKAQVSIPQTLTILIISRAISIVIAWTIWMFYPKGIPHMYSEFIFVPAVISELLLQGINFFTLQYFIKKNG